jgi:hypothetical protein
MRGGAKPLAKVKVLPTASIDHTLDTVITLPQSKYTVEVSKDIPAGRIADMDKYFLTHKPDANPPLSKQVNPDRPWCPDVYLYGGTFLNQYKQVPGKYMGIWNNNVDWTKLHDTYGFTNIFVSLNNDTTIAREAHFQHDSMIVGIDLLSATQTLINDNGKPAYKYYYTDEPIDRAIPNSYFLNVASWIYQKSTTAKFIFSEYQYADFDILCQSDGSLVKAHWLPNPNVYIMCDTYNGDGCGDVNGYWNDYKSFYGIPSRNISNFISMSSGHSGDWSNLLTLAMAWGKNPIWIYAGDSDVNESVVQNFCSTAWQALWLLRWQHVLVTVWENTDGLCDWPNGNWKIVESYYDGYRWEHY